MGRGKGYTPRVNSIYNSPCFEGVWMDKEQRIRQAAV
jgi:hypothetical protein